MFLEFISVTNVYHVAVGFAVALSASMLVDIFHIEAVVLVKNNLCSSIVSHFLQTSGNVGFSIHVGSEDLAEFHLHLHAVAPYVFPLSFVDFLAGVVA